MLDFNYGLIFIIVILLLNSLLAAARAAFVNASRPRLRQMAEQNVGGAALAVRVAEDATTLLATLRLSQTFCRFGIASQTALLLTPLFTQPLIAGFVLDPRVAGFVFFVALLIGTMLVVSLGEFLPEALALRAPESTATLFAPAVALLEWLLTPLVRLLLWISASISQPVTGQRVPLVTEEEIKTLVDAGEEGGAIEEEEKEMIYSIFEISDTWARELMVPRIDVMALDVETPLPTAVDALLAAGHSRAPIYENTIDNILGILYAKDLLKLWRSGKLEGSLRGHLRPALFVPETKKANELLAELQARRTHMAIVVDEYGGMAGLVTLEDIVEEIVGDIRDEFDVNEEVYAEKISETEYLFDARINIDEVNELLNTRLASVDSDSLGGYIYGQLGHIPAANEKVTTGAAVFEVLTVTGRRIRKVRATLTPPVPEAEPIEAPRRLGTKPLPQPEAAADE
ncbi:MAG: hemolysin family protein [Anaerolineales bacterium]